MAQLFHIHPEHPQPRLIKQAAEIARSGGLIAMPTDAAYSLAGVAGMRRCSIASAESAGWTSGITSP